MQYANVAVNTKTQKINQVFTYSIPANLLADIKVGILVEVPFRNRKLEGVIVAIKSRSPMGSGSRPGCVGTIKLKPINKILDQNPVLDSMRLELAKWMSNYYLAPIGETIFAMLPAVAKRIVPKGTIRLQPTTYNLKPKIYTLYDSFDSRINDYIKIIHKTIKKNKQVILIFPEIMGKQIVFQKIQKEFGAKNIAYLHGNLTKTQHYQNWLDIRAGKKNIIIGSRAAIFAPVSNLGLIIIDDSENFGHKEEQSPKYHSVTVAKKLAKLSKAHLLLGSSYPSIKNYYYEKMGKYQKLKTQNLNLKNIGINIVDSNKDKGIISWRMEQAITETLKTNGKIILFVNHRGEGSIYLCSDCGYIFNCPHCDVPLAPFSKTITSLRCSKCGYQKDAPSTCPKCNGAILKASGIGTELVEKKVKKLFPNTETLIIDKDNQRTVPTPSGRDPDRSIGVNIIIGTKKILDYPEINADLVGVIGLDSALNIPDYKSNENTFLTLVYVMHKAKQQIVLQTFAPENDIINYFSQQQLDKFLAEELQKRKQNNYPPFSVLIKLVCQGKSEEKCQEEAEKMAKLLSSQPTVNDYQLLGPTPCYIFKKRDKYRYQIILKLKTENCGLKTELSKINFSGWSIDVDPLNLL